MKLAEALDRVYEMAEQELANQLRNGYGDMEEVKDIYEANQKALDIVHDYFVNYLHDKLADEEEEDN